MTPFTATTVAAWPLAVLDTLERRGLDGNLALREAGLERAWLAANPGGRVTVAAMGRLWAAAERLSGDPAIGLYVGLAAQPMHLRILGLLVQTAPSLDQVIDFAVRFQALVSNSVTVSRVHRPGAEGLAIRPLDGTPVHPCALDAFIAAHVHHLVRVAPAGAVTEVALCRPAPADQRPWQTRLCRQVVFDADADVVWHDRARLHTPLPLGDDELSRQHQQLAEQALAELDRSPPLVQTLRGLLRVRPGEPPTLGELAAAVNLSERSLRRHLAEAGSGYRRLIEEHSAERAAALLRGSARSVAEVADQLGFSDASNFSKAFKRWYGVSPYRFRQS
ncbi:MAG: hypothetical protein CL553_12035 [Alcanivorax sp.]|jgi:AraC-like DNA-binding protein|nr:hypothetical protein [Alcanivorax sp.]